MATVASGFDVFVYGSLLAEEVLIKLLGRVPVSSSALVKDFHRYKITDRLYPAVRHRKDGTVIGKVLFGLSSVEMNIFDEFEAEEYVKTPVTATLLGKPSVNISSIRLNEGQAEVEAFMYVWADSNDPRLFGEWEYEEWRATNMNGFLALAFDE